MGLTKTVPSFREDIKQFSYGAALLILVMPLILEIVSFSGYKGLSGNLYFHWLPFAWGVWRVIVYRISLSDGVSGFILGIMEVFYGVFVIQIPQQLGWPVPVVLIGIPLLYALVWHLFFSWLKNGS